MTADDGKLYSPRLAWVRAMLYFALCTLASAWTGVLRALVGTPFVQPGQLDDPLWRGVTLLLFAQLLFGYAYYWPRGTVTYGRPRRVVLALAFGFLWGAAQGQLVLSVYTLVAKVIGNPLWTALVVLVLTSTFLGVWHSRFWDIHVSPDHNVRAWNTRKVLFAHTPFLVLSLVHYTLFHNTALFVLAQAAALMCASVAMRFPAPWDPPLPQHDPAGRPD